MEKDDKKKKAVEDIRKAIKEMTFPVKSIDPETGNVKE